MSIRPKQQSLKYSLERQYDFALKTNLNVDIISTCFWSQVCYNMWEDLLVFTLSLCLHQAFA